KNCCISLKLSDGLVFIPPQPDYDQVGKITISYQDNLDMHLKDLEFFLSLHQTNEFTVNGQNLGVKFESHESLVELESEAVRLRKWVDISRHFDFDPALISLEHVTEKQTRQLDELSRAVSSGGLTAQTFKEQGFGLQPFGQWQLALILETGSENEGTKIRGVTDPGFDFALRSTTEKEDFKRITPYDLFKESDLPYVLNMRLERIVDEYSRIVDYEGSDTYFF